MDAHKLVQLLRRSRFLLALLPVAAVVAATSPRPILFSTAFEGGSLGRIEQLGDAEYRLFVRGQYDERGRNRQASWYYFRVDDVAGRELKLTLTDFVGEYNDVYGANPAGPEMRPVYSYDGERWQPFEDMTWDDAKKEATLTFKPAQNAIWIAHLEPYPWSRAAALVAEAGRSAAARVELIGQTVKGRPLHLVTVTDFARSDDRKKVVWLMARQHAWETGTSFVLEGALRFVLSADPAAHALRERTVFKFVPMMDPDGCAEGQVRFNAHGFDVNRHWDEVDLRDPQWLRKMPEIWYVKKAIRDAQAVQRIDLLINLHNTKTEYVETMVNDAAGQALFRRFFDTLVAETMFDPTRPLILLPKSSTTVVVWPEFGVPAALIELRTTSGQKSARRPTGEDRMKFGAQLITTMARVVQ